MIYKLNIRCKKEESDFLRVLEIDENSDFYSLYKIIHQCAGYDNSQMTSFFASNDEWERFEEITLMDMGVENNNIYVMKDTKLNQFLKKEGDKLIYLFDFFSERFFKIELIDIIEKSSSDNLPICIFEQGEAPVQIKIDDNLDDLDFADESFDEKYFDNDIDDDIAFENIDDLDDL